MFINVLILKKNIKNYLYVEWSLNFVKLKNEHNIWEEISVLLFPPHSLI